MYGIFPIDTNGICSEYETNGLSFIGYYENGIPTGPCWRKLVGGAWMYGIVDENGQFTGKKDIAYIYPDLELLMVGQYKNGLLVINLSHYTGPIIYFIEGGSLSGHECRFCI